MLAKARREGLTLRDLYNLVAAARGHWVLCGSAETMADTLQQWFEERAADGFNVMPPYFPEGFDDFVDSWCRSCRSAACSGATTRARPCATISGCRVRRRGFGGDVPASGARTSRSLIA